MQTYRERVDKMDAAELAREAERIEADINALILQRYGTTKGTQILAAVSGGTPAEGAHVLAKGAGTSDGLLTVQRKINEAARALGKPAPYPEARTALEQVADELAKASSTLNPTAPLGATPSRRLWTGGETAEGRLERYDLIKAAGGIVNPIEYDRAKCAIDLAPALEGVQGRDAREVFGAGPAYVDRRAEATAELQAARESGNEWHIAHAERAVHDADWRHTLRAEAAQHGFPA